jgi:hypothetical protein
MSIDKAIKIITEYQSWRLGQIDKIRHDPKTITTALNVLLETVKNKN